MGTKEVGRQIRERREGLGLSREGLAYKSAVSARTIERLENSEVEPRRATLAMIEQALAAEQEALAA